MKVSRTLACVALALAVTGCTTDPFTGEEKMSSAGKGGLLGGLLGAGVGAVVGEASGVKSRTAILVGAGLGALTGAGVGAYMDRQEADLRRRLQNTGVSVTRDGDYIILNMPGNVTFDFNRAEIKPRFYEVLNSVVLVVKEYDRTLIDIEGHTDSIGSEQANLELSDRRARSVADFLSARQVDPRRIQIRGYGKSRPIATNATREGRALNRRVEIRLTPLRQG